MESHLNKSSDESQKRRAGLIVAQTPATIRGVLPTREPAGIVLDWLSATLPYSPASFELINREIGKLKPEETRIYGYSLASFVLHTGRVFWSEDKPETGIHIRLPATALAEYEDSAYYLLAILVNAGAKFTRLDIAFDDKSGILGLEKIATAWQNGEMVTRFRSMSEFRERVEQGNGQGKLSGLAFGNRQSQSYLRIYDKALEQEKKGELGQDKWIRVELETKDEKACEIAKRLERMPMPTDRADFLTGLLAGLFDIVADPGTDTNKSRWNRVSWWDDFLSGVSKLRLGLPKIARTLNQVKNWFIDYISPMAAVLLLADHKNGMTGYDWLIEAIEAGQDRFTKRHKILAGMV